MAKYPCDDQVLLSSDKRVWYVFLGISAGIYIGGLMVIILGRLIFYKLNKKRQGKYTYIAHIYGSKRSYYLSIMNFAGELESSKNLAGKILNAMSILTNMAAFGIYVVRSEKYPIEYCSEISSSNKLYSVELALYIFFFIRFVLRFLAAQDKLTTWTWDLYTLVDVLTIPLVFHEGVQGSSWLGLRFLRIVYLRKLPLLLNHMNILDSGSSLEMGYIIGNFFSMLFSFAGMSHLLENTGDFWGNINYTNNRKAVYGKYLNYFDCIYFVVVTISTVGYGDISCGTYLGRAFSLLVIIFGLSLFATYSPVIFEFISSHTKYNRKFSATSGKKHVIVTGNINNETVSAFIQDFLHPDREQQNTTIVFLAPRHPSLHIQSIIQRHYTNVCYYSGNVYKHHDCERVNMKNAAAVIVLCDKRGDNPEAEDATNITRVILMKKFYRRVRCIVQLIRRDSKCHLLNCPQWKEGYDSILCIDELKLGFMAQSCNAPGFSTLMSNLFVMRQNDEKKYTDGWRTTYLHGVACELYSTELSDYFAGMTFTQVVDAETTALEYSKIKARICFENLDILLMAVSMENDSGEKIFAINPGRSLRIEKGARGIFCAQEYTHVERAQKYCGNCHRHFKNGRSFIQCVCLSTMNSSIDNLNTSADYKEQVNLSMEITPIINSTNDNEQLGEQSVPRFNVTMDEKEADNVMFDQTGTYFWCEDRDYEDSIMTLKTAEANKYVGHVVILVVSDRHAPKLGLRQLIQPLRASNQPANDLKKIILLGDEAFIAREWRSICNFPDVHIVKDSPYSRVALRAINVHTADMCILLSPSQCAIADSLGNEAISDKEVIMVTLNLRAMTFENHDRLVSNSDFNVTTPPTHRRSPRFQRIQSEKYEEMEVIHSISGENITLITELVDDSNTLYMDDEIQSEELVDDIYMTQSYACGSVFTVSVLDFLASATYFNIDVLKLLQNLLTGTVNPELERILHEGRYPEGVKENTKVTKMRNRSRVEQLSLNDPIFAEIGRLNEFGELFNKALNIHGMMCLGLYRLHTTQTVSLKSLSTRYVITFPPKNMKLEPTDLVFVLIPFSRSCLDSTV